MMQKGFENIEDANEVDSDDVDPGKGYGCVHCCTAEAGSKHPYDDLGKPIPEEKYGTSDQVRFIK